MRMSNILTVVCDAASTNHAQRGCPEYSQRRDAPTLCVDIVVDVSMSHNCTVPSVLTERNSGKCGLTAACWKKGVEEEEELKSRGK